MRVVINAESIKYPLAGIGYYTQALISGLRGHGEIDELLCFDGARLVGFPEAECLLSPGAGGIRKNGFFKRRLRGLPGAYRARSRLRKSFFKNACRSLNEQWLYHEPNFILMPFAGKRLATVHDLSYIHFPSFHPSERVRYLERELPRTLGCADCVITSSMFVKKELINVFKMAAERISVVPLGVSKDFRPYAKTETVDVLNKYCLSHGQYLLSVATLEPRKNLQGLISAFLKLPISLRRRYPLVLAGGSGWKNRDLGRVVEKLETAGELRRLGYVPAAHLPYIYAGARAFAFPSFYEGFGLPPLEAMASGIPVLAAGNSSMVEVVGEAGILVPAADCGSISAGLEEILTDELGWGKLREKGLTRAAQFTWEKVAEDMVAAYQRIFEGT